MRPVAGQYQQQMEEPMEIPRTGGCLCGAIRYESVGDPVFALQCHCRDCQRQGGSAFIAAIRVPSAGFRLTQGTPRRYMSCADSGNDTTRVSSGDRARAGGLARGPAMTITHRLGIMRSGGWYD